MGQKQEQREKKKNSFKRLSRGLTVKAYILLIGGLLYVMMGIILLFLQTSILNVVWRREISVISIIVIVLGIGTVILGVVFWKSARRFALEHKELEERRQHIDDAVRSLEEITDPVLRSEALLDAVDKFVTKKHNSSHDL